MAHRRSLPPNSALLRRADVPWLGRLLLCEPSSQHPSLHQSVHQGLPYHSRRRLPNFDGVLVRLLGEPRLQSVQLPLELGAVFGRDLTLYRFVFCQGLCLALRISSNDLDPQGVVDFARETFCSGFSPIFDFSIRMRFSMGLSLARIASFIRVVKSS